MKQYLDITVEDTGAAVGKIELLAPGYKRRRLLGCKTWCSTTTKLAVMGLYWLLAMIR